MTDHKITRCTDQEQVRYCMARATLLKACGQLDRLRHRLECARNPDKAIRYVPSEVPKTETLSDILAEMEKLLEPTAKIRAELDALPEKGTYSDIMRVANALGIKLQ
jgi:hypothetical protein